MDADEAKRRSRGIGADMSPQALARRLELASELYDAWLALRGARRLGPEPGVAEGASEPYGDRPSRDEGRGPTDGTR